MPEKSRPKLNMSVVICTKNRTRDLRDCFDSMISQTHMPHEMIIVDSSDTDATKELVEDYKTKINIPFKYVHTAPSLTRQRNIGIGVAGGDIITFLDDDVILEPDYFKEIMNVFQSSTAIVAVGGNITNGARLTGINKVFRTVFLLGRQNTKKGYMQRSGFTNDLAYHTITEVTETEALSGCNCSYRKKVLADHSFDEFFDGYCQGEDVEFSYRVGKEKGNKMVITPFAKLVHKRSPVDRTKVKRLFEMRMVNHYYIFTKLVKSRNNDWLFFWWSSIGVIILSIFHSIKTKNLSVISGVFSGYKKIIELAPMSGGRS